MKFVKYLPFVVLISLVLCVGYWYYSGNVPNTKRHVPIKEIAPQSETDFTRSFVGKLISYDIDKLQVSIVGDNGKIYVFAVPESMVNNQDESLYLPKDSKIEIKWRDEVSTQDLLIRYNKDPSQAINTSVNSFSITPVK